MIDNFSLRDALSISKQLPAYFDRGVHPNLVGFFGSPILELLLCHPLTHVGVVMITTIIMACVAGFFIGIATHLAMTQLAQKIKVETQLTL